MRLTVVALAALLSGQAALAAGDALLIGNGSEASSLRFGEERIDRAADALRGVGFDVTERSDATDGEMRAAFARFVNGLEGSDGPVVVVLAGDFVHSETGAWFLAPTARETVDPVRIMTAALPLDAVLTVLARHPGRALLLLGETETANRYGPYLRPGSGALDIPQGVSVLRGPEEDIMRFVPREVPRAGRNMAALAQRYELERLGYAPDPFVILRLSDLPDTQDDAQRDDPEDDRQAALEAERRAADEAGWALAREADSAVGYRQYLRGFPEGEQVAAARQRLAAIEAEPFYAQRRAEEALELSRDARREIQRDLSLLGHDPRGIDGLFGAGTRRAVTGWQTATGLEASGYLDARQITLLDEQARARAATLEAEARQRQAAQERRDNALWQNVEQQGNEAGLRRYLAEFPDGLHATRARDLLAEIERQRGRTAAEQDRRAWNQAREADTVNAYRTYLESRPGGAFAGEAEARIAALGRAEEQNREAAQARSAENALGLNPVARRLAEARLEQLGLEPGRVDGEFDSETRRAIRRYQRDRGLTVSGYLDQNTVVRLLADGILGR